MLTDYEFYMKFSSGSKDITVIYIELLVIAFMFVKSVGH